MDTWISLPIKSDRNDRKGGDEHHLAKINMCDDLTLVKGAARLITGARTAKDEARDQSATKTEAQMTKPDRKATQNYTKNSTNGQNRRFSSIAFLSVCSESQPCLPYMSDTSQSSPSHLQRAQNAVERLVNDIESLFF